MIHLYSKKKHKLPKCILACVIAGCMVFHGAERVSFPIVQADETEDAYTDAQGITYTPNQDGTCTASGYTSDVETDLVIPEKVTIDEIEYPVTSIDEYGFWDCDSLTSVSIPECNQHRNQCI